MERANLAEYVWWTSSKWNFTVHIRPQLIRDQLVWTETRTGQYTIKSRYNTFHKEDNKKSTEQASSSFQTPRKLWNRIWNMQIPDKIKKFIWSLCQNALPTKENLFKRRTIPDPLCPMCQAHVETLEHIFLLCEWLRSVWNDPVLKIEISEYHISRIDSWLVNYTQKEESSLNFELISTSALEYLEIKKQPCLQKDTSRSEAHGGFRVTNAHKLG